MSNELTVTQFGQEELELIKSTKAVGATQAEFNLFVYDCQSRGLNPLKNQIYFVKRGAKGTHQVGIDGFRSIAQRTGEYEGQTPVKYSEISAEGAKCPEWVEVGVWRKGFREALVARAYFKEYFQTSNMIWKTMPIVMLSKCAEALALRKAFPDDLGGLYTSDEMPDVKHVENTIITPSFNPPDVPVEKDSGDELPFEDDRINIEITKDVINKTTGEVLATAGDTLCLFPSRKIDPKTNKPYPVRVVKEPAGNFKGVAKEGDKARWLSEAEFDLIAGSQK